MRDKVIVGFVEPVGLDVPNPKQVRRLIKNCHEELSRLQTRALSEPIDPAAIKALECRLMMARLGAFSRRDWLISCVVAEKMKPERAEALATRYGCEPLEYKPDPADFDPLKVETWSLLMTLAWIGTRSIDLVRDTWDDYRRTCRSWGTAQRIIKLSEHGPATVERLNLYYALDRIKQQSPVGPALTDDAFAKLKAKAIAGEVEAWGIPLTGGAAQPIEPQRWRFLMLRDKLHQGQDMPTLVQSEEVGFRDVSFDAKVVRSIWPVPKKANAAKTACTAWLRKLAGEHPKASPKTKRELYVEARQLFPGIAKDPGQHSYSRAFEDAWNKTVPASWRRGGRPRGK